VGVEFELQRISPSDVRIAQQHTHDLDEYKEQNRENARRILAKYFVLMTTYMYRKREYIVYIKYFFKAMRIYGLASYI